MDERNFRFSPLGQFLAPVELWGCFCPPMGSWVDRSGGVIVDDSTNVNYQSQLVGSGAVCSGIAQLGLERGEARLGKRDAGMDSLARGVCGWREGGE